MKKCVQTFDWWCTLFPFSYIFTFSHLGVCFCHSSCPCYLEAKHHWRPSCSPAPSFCFCYVSCRRAPLTPLPGIEPLWEGTDGSRLRPPPSSRQWVPVPCAAERALAWLHVPCALPMGTVVVVDTLKKLPPFSTPACFISIHTHA